MSHPPRLGHLATRAVLIAKLAPTYAQAHQIDEDEARERLDHALKPRLLEQLLSATWDVLLSGSKRLDESGLLEKVAQSLKERPLRPGRVANVTPAFSAFLLLLDLELGTASDAARKVMETEEGRRRGADGMKEAAQHLANELTRK